MVSKHKEEIMEVKILFGSENSEAEDLAIIAKNDLEKLGFDTEIINMSEAYLCKLSKFKNILLIIGTSFDKTTAQVKFKK